MTPTTAPVTTTGSVTTDPSTTTAPVTTTVPVTTTAPIEISQNPIKSVSLSSDGTKLIVKYKNDVSQNLVTEVPVREGYNAALLKDYDFDTETHILTLTYADSISENHALVILEEALPPLGTFYIREMNGKLQYTCDDALIGWREFASAGRSPTDGGVPILTKLLDVAEFGKQKTESLGSGTVLNIYAPAASDSEKGNHIRIRAREWMREGYDFVTDARLHGSFNFNFMLKENREISSSLPNNAKDGGIYFKNASDDIASILINGTYIGANHGYNNVAAIPNSAGLTEEDIGSVWKCGTQKFLLVKVNPGDGMLWFFAFDDASMSSGYFNYVAINQGAVLNHVSGATHTGSITATANCTRKQLYIATNHVTQRVFLNGTVEIDPEEVGVYEAEFIDIYEYYDIIYLPTMFTYLMENVGSNTNESQHDECLADAYLSFCSTYRFHKNGAMVTYNDYIFRTDVKLFQAFSVNCSTAVWPDGAATAPTQQYVYFPGTTTYNTPILQVKGGSNVEWDRDDLEDPDTATSSYFQFTDAVGSKGMNLGYYPLYGDAIAATRYEQTGERSPFGVSQNTLKMYPRVIDRSGTTPLDYKNGDRISTVSYRIPTVATDEDMLAVNHYWVGDEIVLMLHTQKALNGKELTLPDYMNGMAVTVIEKSNSMTIGSSAIENGRITFSTTDVGYAFIKLTPAN